MIPGTFGLPTTDEKTALGASSPAKPALQTPDPLSITTAVTSSSIYVF
jgi:hypothetical protein